MCGRRCGPFVPTCAAPCRPARGSHVRPEWRPSRCCPSPPDRSVRACFAPRNHDALATTLPLIPHFVRPAFLRSLRLAHPVSLYTSPLRICLCTPHTSPLPTPLARSAYHVIASLSSLPASPAPPLLVPLLSPRIPTHFLTPRSSRSPCSHIISSCPCSARRHIPLAPAGMALLRAVRSASCARWTRLARCCFASPSRGPSCGPSALPCPPPRI